MKFGQFVLGCSILLNACTSVQAREQNPSEVPAAVLSRGQRIYLGSVFPLHGNATSPTYVYERRVERQELRQISTHITREPSGSIVLAESATETADHQLLDYTLHANQLGQTGSIHVVDGRLLFHRVSGGDEQTESEALNGPVAVGPTLVGFVMRNLDALRAGATVGLRLALLDRLETVGFELSAAAAKPGETRIEMSPSSFLIGLVVDPIYFTFDASNDKLLRLEGRVPPKLRAGHGWSNFDARVEYVFVANDYL